MSRGHEFQGQGGLGDLPLDLETGHRAKNPAQPAPGQGQGQRQSRAGLRARLGDPAPASRVAFMPWIFKTIAGSKQYLNVNEYRRYLLVQNNSAADLWINFGADAGNGIGLVVVSGGSAEWYAAMFGR